MSVKNLGEIQLIVVQIVDDARRRAFSDWAINTLTSAKKFAVSRGIPGAAKHFKIMSTDGLDAVINLHPSYGFLEGGTMGAEGRQLFPVTRRFMRFISKSGDLVFARRVTMRGIPPKWALKDAYVTNTEEYQAKLIALIREGLNRNMTRINTLL